ncbi:MAG: VOC family protein [Saprospiraceae bacterium]|nr:VOC family protein [Saprospiraceae bacterium]
MLSEVHPKLPMKDKSRTRNYYINGLGFEDIGVEDYEGYLILKKDHVEIHFFEFKNLDVLANFGQVYIRTDNIEKLYLEVINKNIKIHENGSLKTQSWGQKEFSLLDPDHNLLTFGQGE